MTSNATVYRALIYCTAASTQRVGAWTLSLPGLPGGVASVAFSLAGGLIFNDTRYTGVVGGLSRFNLGRGRCLDGCLRSGCKSFEAGALLKFQ
ncbi:hypothetical protein KX729_27705 [Rhizobium sp. XQZ8]|nr:hypothetical protein [Rhizobium populisoli]